MVDENFIVELIVDPKNSAATLLELANIMAKVNSSLDTADPTIAKVEKGLVKLATSASDAAKAEVELQAAADKAQAALDKQSVALAKGTGQLDAHIRSWKAYTATQAEAAKAAAEAAAKEAAALAKVEESLAAAAQQTAIYNQYLYDEVKALTGVSLSVDKLSEANYGQAKSEAYAQKQAALYNDTLALQARNLDRTAQSLSTTRYALFSASQTMGQTGLALIALAALPVIVSTSFSKEFAQVTRTVNRAGNDTKQALINLSQQIPVSFKDLAGIAALGGQLGIKKSGIIDFTRTVAMLTATTNLTAEAAGTMLGRFQALLGLPSSQFENLASAVLDVGVNTVATEKQIVAIATGIASVAKIAGFTAPQVIGLSGALASLGDQPYLSRGVITRFFTTLGSEVAAAGPKFQEFAKIAGITQQQLASDYGTNRFAGDFQLLVDNLAKFKAEKGPAALSDEFKALGISGSQALHVFDTLVISSKELDQANALAAQGFSNTSVLMNQYNIIQTTTAAKAKILQNSFEALLNGIGSQSQGPVSAVLDGLNGLLKSMNDINANPIAQRFETIAAELGVTVGVLLLLAAGTARGAAGIIGVTQALTGLRVEEIRANGIFRSFADGLVGIGVGADRAKVAVLALQASIAPLTAIAAVVALATIGNDALIKSSGVIQDPKVLAKQLASQTGGQTSSNINKAFGGVGILDNSAKYAVGQLTNSTTGGIANFLADVQNSTFGRAASAGSAISSFGLTKLSGNTDDLGIAKSNIQAYDKALAQLVGSGNLSAAVRGYDALSQSQAFQGVTSKQLSSLLPTYNEALKKLTDANQAASKATKALNADFSTEGDLATYITKVTGLTAKQQDTFASSLAKSTSTLTDFNNVVGQVQADNSKKANTTNSRGKPTGAYYDGFSVSLDDYTKKLTDNTGKQQDWYNNLLLLQNKANAQIAGSGKDVASQLITAGYSVTNASLLQQLVDATPPQLAAYIKATVKAANLASKAAAQAFLAGGYIVDSKTGGALSDKQTTAFGGLIGAGATPQDAAKLVGAKYTSTPVTVPIAIDPAQAQAGFDQFANKNKLLQIQAQLNSDVSAATLAGDAAGRAFAGGVIRGVGNTATTLGIHLRGGTALLADGGPVFGAGTATSDSIPARLSNGEYVIRAASVRQYGQGLFDQLNRGIKTFAQGGPVGYAGGGNVSSSDANSGPSHVANVNVQLVNPLTKDPLRQLRENSEMIAAGIWGAS